MRGSGKQQPEAATVDVLEPGLSTTIQDFGRPGWMRVGLPQGGALDREALRLAHALASGCAVEGFEADGGGPAALEIRYLGPVLKVRSGMVRAALVGADVRMRVERAGAEGEASHGAEYIEAWRSVTLQAGDVLKVGGLKNSSCALLALSGGIKAPLVLGARATFERGGFGGLDGRKLRAGDCLQVSASQGGFSGAERWISPESRPASPALNASGAFMARVVLGPQAHHFSAEALEQFLTAEWRVSRDADRMGVRLEGPSLAHEGGEAAANILSEGVCAGVVQVPANGAPIVLLADRGATGGYPKIAVVASVDLPLLGRLQPGDRLCFEAIEPDAARDALLQRTEAVTLASNSVGVFHEPGQIDEERLLEGNLITAQISNLLDN